jgi:HEAT repeat protein
MTLAAALRDVAHADVRVRGDGARNLAPALLAELQRPGPAWRADEDHPRGAEVTAALLRALDDADPQVKGLAAVGLGLLGRREVVDMVVPWIAIAGEDPASEFLRETAVIALSFIGTAAPQGEEELRATVALRLREALRSTLPDVRFQSALALVEVEGDAALTSLLAALAQETHERVREQIVVAFAHLSALDSVVCDRLADIALSPEEGPASIGFEAAIVLAAHRRSEAGPRLVVALHHRGERDRALEALAALGTAAPPDAARATRRLAKGWLTPPVTRVRAAYAWAAVQGAPLRGDHPAIRLLRRLAWHPRASVREAVADATRALSSRPMEPSSAGPAA